MSDEIQKGKRFTHVYMNRGSELLADSQRARRRLGAAASALAAQGFDIYLCRELGTQPVSITKFFSGEDIGDVLDAVTVLFRHLLKSANESSFTRDKERYRSNARLWVIEVARIFEEERLSFKLDDLGGVHRKIDAEFDISTAATIAGLGRPRYANSAEQFGQSQASLDANPPDAKSAIRSVFQAAEGLFRLMSKEASLAKDETIRYLQPLLQKKFTHDVPARVSSMKMLASFQDWIAACHQYRHEPGTEEPAQPPLDLAILLVSQGAGFIRWLVELDQGAQQ